jgi:hypothetical protein
MKGIEVRLQPVSHWLVAWLISIWGTVLLLIGTLALATSASVYLTRTYDHQAQERGRAPGAVTPISVQSVCTSLAAGVALPCTDTLPAISATCTTSDWVLAYTRHEVFHCQ